MHAIPPGVVARRIAPAAEGSDVAAHYRQRASDARRLSAALTDILRANRPIDLSAVEPGARGPVDEPASSDGTGKTGH